MKNLFRHAEQSVTAKLTIAVGCLIIAGSLLFWTVILQKQKKDVTAIAVKYGFSFLNYIKKRTRHGMHVFNRSDIQQTLEDISIAEGVDRVRMYSHAGRISFSTLKEEIGSPVDTSSLACTGCHPSAESLPALLPEPENWNVYKDPRGYTALKLVQPVLNESSCSASGCHAQNEADTILGFVEADVSLALLDEARMKQGVALMAYIFTFLFAVSLSSVIIIWKFVTRPVSELAQIMKRVTSGDLDNAIPVTSRDEMGMLAASFNSMMKELKAVKDRLDARGKTLEAEVTRKTEVIREAHTGMVQTEKLASLGRLASGIAGELNTPLMTIESTARLIQERKSPHSPESEDLQVIIEQAGRSEKIIRNFLHFSAARPAVRNRININEVLEKTIFFLKNQKKFRQVTIDFSTEDVPVTALGEVSQFQQVFLNMLINAADAMDERGTITVATRKIIEDNTSFVEVEFTDTGPGIREEDMPRLFEPFFSTRPEEKGTGLGLSVCHGIVSHLGGNIHVSSAEGRGTSFFVRFPYHE